MDHSTPIEVMVEYVFSVDGTVADCARATPSPAISASALKIRGRIVLSMSPYRQVVCGMCVDMHKRSSKGLGRMQPLFRVRLRVRLTRSSLAAQEVQMDDSRRPIAGRYLRRPRTVRWIVVSTIMCWPSAALC